jgi:hypothetical protein
MARARKAVGVLVLLSAGFGAGALASPRDHLGKLTGATKHLDAALMSLNETTEDFGGHKTKVAGLIRQAQDELHQAEAFAQSH